MIVVEKKLGTNQVCILSNFLDKVLFNWLYFLTDIQDAMYLLFLNVVFLDTTTVIRYLKIY